MNAMTMNLMGSTPMVQAPVTVEENKLMSDNSNKFLDLRLRRFRSSRSNSSSAQRRRMMSTDSP